MSRSDIERQRHEASIMKMRAMRLRALGDEKDQWDAILLLRRAAEKELAVAHRKAVSEQEQARALIEACGLFLEARDPVRATEQWLRLPGWVFASNTSMLERLKPLYREATRTFAADWFSLKKKPSAPPAYSGISDRKLNSLTKNYPGVAEFWWILANRKNDKKEAAVARDRMRQLEPAFEQDNAARESWEQIEHKFIRNLTIAMQAERQGTILLLESVSRITTAFNELFGDFIDETFGNAVGFLPQSARAGSFILDVAAWGLPRFAIAEFDQKLTHAPERVGPQRIMELVALLRQNNVKLTVSTDIAPIDFGFESGDTEATSITLDAKRCRALLEAAKIAALRTLDSRDIPQADDLLRVFKLVELLESNEMLDPDTLDITKRQVDYYRRAAKILGLLTESDELTAAGSHIVRLDAEDRLRTAVVYFESSVCGNAWIEWSEGKTLLDVNPDEAFDFLQESVPGLNAVTAERRAQTLVAWHRLLSGYHYAAGPS